MKTLIHNQIKDNIPSNSSRNGYGYVEYTDALDTDSSNQYSSSTITFSHDEMDSKRIPFTIRMLSPGKLKLLLLPDLGIQDVTFLVINGPNKLDSQTFFYDHHDVNWFETTTYSEGDEIRILVKWVSIATNRTFGVQQNFNFSAAEIGSCLMGTGKYEVFGNMGSLLFDWNDNRWIADDYSIVGNNTFKQFFMGVDTAYIDTENTANSASQIYAEASLTSGLVSARNLYLPPLNVRYAYFKLFYGNTDLKYGPRRIHVCAKASYCEQLLDQCNYIESDYDVFVTSSIANGENYNMRYMFRNIGSENGITNKAGTLYYAEPNIYISYSEDMVESVGGGSLGSFSNYVFSPGGNIEGDYKKNIGMNIGAPDATPAYKILNPIIWVDDVQAVIDAESLGDVSEYINRNYEGTPYVYKGTIWVSSEHKSYYLWEYISKYDTSSVSQDPYATMGTTYILTSEKDFTGMTLKETGKIMVYPIKFIASTLTQISCKTYTIDCADYIDYDLSNCTIIKQSCVIPNADAGVPVIAVDKSYNTWGEPTTINYKHFRNSQYKYFNYSDQIGYMWQLCLTQYDENSPHTIINDENYEDVYSGVPKYIVTQHLSTRYNVYSKPWDLSITFLERGSEMIWAGISNYYNIEMLNRDETIYVPQDHNDPPEGAKNIFIITTNGIMPETCDYIIE